MISKRFLQLFFTYLTLIVFCVIAIYPVAQVITISLRPGDRLLSTSLKLIPDNATFDNYISLFVTGRFSSGCGIAAWSRSSSRRPGDACGHNGVCILPFQVHRQEDRVVESADHPNVSGNNAVASLVHYAHQLWPYQHVSGGHRYLHCNSPAVHHLDHERLLRHDTL